MLYTVVRVIDALLVDLLVYYVLYSSTLIPIKFFFG